MNEPAVQASVCAGADRARFRRAVAAHFAGRIDPRDESALRIHLVECAACRRLYRRALVLSEADPRALPARERLARGLGLRAAPAPADSLATRRWARLLLPALGAIVLVTVGVTGRARRRSVSEASNPPGSAASGLPAPRGPEAAAPALLAYRIPAHGAPMAIDKTIDRRDELAFAYANPGGWPYVMVFAVDEHDHVYWYHPAWRVGAPPPVAVPARGGIGPFELPSATRHAFDGRRLSVYAVFARQPLGVEEIERAARAADGPGGLQLPRDLQVVRRELEVSP
jgi:hypothetical protein